MDENEKVEVIDGTGEIVETAIEPYQQQSVGLVYTSAKEVMMHKSEAAKELERLAEMQHLYVQIGSGKHLKIEGWTTVGSYYNATPMLEHDEFIDIGGVWGAKATVVIVNTITGKIISRATAICMSDEPNWKNKSKNHILSMSQTRASSKALRMVFSPIAILAGYEPTPAEEMDGIIKHYPQKKEPVDPKHKEDTITFKKWMDTMAAEKDRIGTASYYMILHKAGFEHANEVKERKVRTEIYKEMQTMYPPEQAKIGE